jgi:arginine decarboxylase
MPGENIGPADGAWLTFIRVLQEWGETFPGFAKEVEGAIEKDGVYHVYCLK